MSTAPTNAHTHIHHTNTQIIIRGLRQSLALAVAKLNDLSIVTTDAGGKQAVREVLEKCAGTALNSKLIAQQKARALFVCDQILLFGFCSGGGIISISSALMGRAE